MSTPNYGYRTGTSRQSAALFDEGLRQHIAERLQLHGARPRADGRGRLHRRLGAGALCANPFPRR